MKKRFNVSENGRRFASVHATSPEEAIKIACRVTGRPPEDCVAETVNPLFCPQCRSIWRDMANNVL